MNLDSNGDVEIVTAPGVPVEVTSETVVDNPVGIKVGFDDPVIAIEFEGKSYVFHLWERFSEEHSVEVSSKAAQNDHGIQEVTRKLPSRFSASIRCASEVDVRQSQFNSSTVVTQHNERDATYGARAQVDRLRSFLKKRVKVTTRAGVLEGVMSKVNVSDDGQFDNVIMVEIEVLEILSSSKPVFGTLQAALPTPKNKETSIPGSTTATYNVPASIVKMSWDKVLTRLGVPQGTWVSPDRLLQYTDEVYADARKTHRRNQDKERIIRKARQYAETTMLTEVVEKDQPKVKRSKLVEERKKIFTLKRLDRLVGESSSSSTRNGIFTANVTIRGTRRAIVNATKAATDYAKRAVTSWRKKLQMRHKRYR